MDAHEIAAALRSAIAAGDHPHGSKLPTIRQTAERYAVSHQTAASAYSVLSALGMVRTDRRSGTTVIAGRSADAHLGTFAPPDLSAAEAWKPTTDGTASEATTLVRQTETSSVDGPPWVSTDGGFVERTRIRSVDGAPVQHKLTVLPYSVASRAPEGCDGVPPMLAPVGAAPVKPPHGVRVADWLGWNVARTECTITAEPMSPEACTALGMPQGAPGFRVLAVAYDPEGGAVFATITTAPLHHRVTLDIIG
ncbi:GntR family transcriptional regulator [Streptomyces sp. SHP 1-2]|uniref:GntR family transcriptional regulator n=1 Tax=Streptomyces sp. SHP 1-2 TaxID=2769489 RepID=UPI002237991F|nr:GntR family transcriptional regulator [Streptomyces sp. SHP 1-2]MCW5254723.1 GntR family transcriptional regulator [Streptomyces sp. SHP 1-2]